MFFVNVVQRSYSLSSNLAVEIVSLCSGMLLSHGVFFLLALKRFSSLRSIFNAV